MRLLKPLLFCSFVCIVGFATAVTGEPPKGFRSQQWGARPATGLKKFSGPTADGTSLYVPASGKTLQPLFDISVTEEAYSYTRGKFYSGSAWLDGQPNLEKMKVAISKIYGSPTFSNEQLGTWRWKWPNSKIEITLTYQAKFARTTVTFLNNSI